MQRLDHEGVFVALIGILRAQFFGLPLALVENWKEGITWYVCEHPRAIEGMRVRQGERVNLCPTDHESFVLTEGLGDRQGLFDTAADARGLGL